ncbi:unnamed protein product, partial [marine sediment metagenome]
CILMIHRFLFTAALTIFALTNIAPYVAYAEPEMCKRLAEISSFDPDKQPLFQYKTREER